MNEREIFLSALEIDDPAARQAHLQAACADDPELLARVESLLTLNDNQSQFLETPVVEQISDAGNAATMPFGDGSTQEEALDVTVQYTRGSTPMTEHDDNEISLGFMEPSTKPGSLGRLAHYEVLQVIGRGAFGIVLRAFDEKLQRVVAIKVMSPEMASTSPARKRFLREAQASAAIRHEHVVSVYAVEEKPIPYLVMEFIPGLTLQQRLDERGPLDLATVLRLGRQIAEGLAAAHAQELIHRDIKPGNILLEAGILDKVKITDFGLARAADDASLTQSGTIAGTPMYMAPEQALGHKLDQRADLFSFGSVLYQMVSGRPPFRANGTLAVLKRVTEDTPRPIREIIPETPQWLCDIITKLHAKNPDERYQSAREIADVLANCETQLKTHSGLKDFSVIPSPKKPTATLWKRVAAAMLLLPLLVLGLYALNRPATQTEPSTKSTTGSIAAVTPEHAREAAVPGADGWVQLFNGKDLTGWKTHPDQRGDWDVKDGVLVGSKVGSYLFSDGNTFENFHLRIEAKINRSGDSGIFFRSPFVMRPGRTADSLRPAGGYEVELHRNRDYNVPTGSIWNAESVGIPKLLIKAADLSVTEIDDWFHLEIIARGNHFITRVNGTQIAECDDPNSSFREGHLALQVLHPQTIVQFRKIEITELPASTPASAIVPFDAAQARAHQEAWAKHLGVPVEYTNSIGMKFMLIPPGEFMMGSTPEEIASALKDVGEDKHWQECIKSEAPQHKVILTQPIYLGVNEVTQGAYEKVMGTNPSSFAPMGMGKVAVAGMQTTEHPVEMVSWNDAAEFCAKLSKQEKLKPFYFRADESITPLDGTGYRLPSEAEWEFACRAGTATKYWFGDNDDDLVRAGWFGGNAGGRTHAAGELKANPFGLYDMHGNVWEWVQDGWDATYYGQFHEKPAVNPGSPFPAGSLRLFRGGNWHFAASGCRSSNRNAPHDPSARSDGIGFRVLLPVDAVKAAKQERPMAVTNHEPLPPAFKNSLGMEFVIVPKGKSWLGGGKDKLGDKEVEFTDDFYLGKYEVTQDEWTQVMGENPSYFSRTGEGKDAVMEMSDADLKRFPVESVSWDECQLFVARLNQLENETGWVYRLPKATEWEYACRGGPMTAKADSAFDFYFAKPTNNPLREQEGFGRNKGLNRTGKVGSNEANALGIFDMHRNVWEWCDDRRDAADGKIQRVQMGGGWNHIRWRSAAANIESELPSHRSNALGLRLARVPAGARLPEVKTPPSATAPFTEADIKRIAALPAAEQVEEVRKELKKRNPDFDGTLTPMIENDVVTGIEFFTNRVSDISPVRAFPRLTSLNCRADGLLVGMVSDLKPLQGMQLVKLTLSVNPVSDLTPLQGMPLTDLHIDNSNVADLSPLEGMPLKVLNCSFTKVSSLAPLKGMPLRILWANNTEIASLSPVKGMQLEWITIQETKVKDHTSLQGMPLTQIYLDFEPERDTELLRGIRTLENINDNPSTKFWKELDPK